MRKVFPNFLFGGDGNGAKVIFESTVFDLGAIKDKRGHAEPWHRVVFSSMHQDGFRSAAPATFAGYMALQRRHEDHHSNHYQQES